MPGRICHDARISMSNMIHLRPTNARNRRPNPVKFLVFFCLISLSSFVLSSTKKLTANIAVKESPTETLDKFWTQAKRSIYPLSKEKTHFTDSAYLALKNKSDKASSVYELSDSINDFLATLEVSHTGFYHDQDIEYYLFRSMFSTREINKPKVHHIGLQFVESEPKYVVREVLDGYPAHKAGFKRGDVIVQANGKPFHPFKSFNLQAENRPVELLVSRNGKHFNKTVTAILENPSYSFLQAVKHSKKIINLGDKRVGYIHLWTGIHADVLAEFEKVIYQEFLNLDGIILDLRGGFGGAWYPYIDPFFATREDFYSYTALDKDGSRKVHHAQPKKNDDYFTGPLVVLINEGVRSGKEALAYQFKKSSRAKLIGTTTMGAFTAGKGIFNQGQNYFLYIASSEYLLDGNKIEGIGITPDIEIKYPHNKTLIQDPQYQRAIEEIRILISNSK